MVKTFKFYLPCFLFFIPLFFVNSELSLIPSAHTFFLGAYNDAADSSMNSSCTLSTATDSLLVFDYTLRLKDPTSGKDPYVGLAIDLNPRDSFYDITPYKYLYIDIITKQDASFNVQLKTFIEGFTRYNDFRTYHIETFQIPVHLGSKRYIVPLKNFHTPDWWYKEVGPKASSLPKEPDNTKFFGINFQNGSGTLLDVPDQFRITKIAFVKEHRLLPTICIGGFCLSLVITFLILLILDKRLGKTRLERVVSYKQLDVKNSVDEEVKRLTDYIGSHFQDPDITVEQVGRETGITPTRIPLILQQKVGKVFKQYLNEVRITESKRLLKETDRTITEIAFAVGYNNVTHFNRVFRLALEKSPTAFRESLKS